MLFERYKRIVDVQYKTIPCRKLTEEELKQCKELFDNHYGIWGKESGGREGKRIKFPMKRYVEYKEMPNTYVALAIYQNEIIGQAFYLRDLFGKNDYMSWVLQLVVHSRYRKQGIAKTLLYSIWGFSGDYAWGLATSNALTVKTLEKATFRSVFPSEMMKRSAKINMIKDVVPFVKDAKPNINNTESIINSGFPVDEMVISHNLKLYKGNWRLGQLPVGYEWLAFTFRDQPYNISKKDYDEMVYNSEKIVNDAYNRMNLPLQSWNKHQQKEVDFILEKLKMEDISVVFDFGCGNGRHALEFAKRGCNVIGIDYSERNIKMATSSVVSEKVKFEKADCRKVNLHQKANLILCLYDVVGSFVKYKDNFRILKNIHKHLKRNGYLVLSVMNLELTESIAKYTVEDVRKNPRSLIKLTPSNIMQKSGDIFSPEHFLLESSTGIVYRKEQFENDDDLSAEYVIRDKRFSRSEIEKMVTNAGFSIVETRFVRAGRWSTSLAPKDKNAKEILIFAKKKKKHDKLLI